jgi:hypothetical protein
MPVYRFATKSVLRSLYGACAFALLVGSASAELSSSDLASIGGAVAAAINNAKAGLPAGATSAEIQLAIEGAISAETQKLISEHRNQNAMIIAEAVITAAIDDGASPSEVGKGMAEAALAEGGGVGIEIADAVGSTAPSGAVATFEVVASGAGTKLGTELADAAQSYVAIGAGGRSGGSRSMNFFGGTGTASGSGGGGGGGCKNPSCT